MHSSIPSPTSVTRTFRSRQCGSATPSKSKSCLFAPTCSRPMHAKYSPSEGSPGQAGRPSYRTLNGFRTIFALRNGVANSHRLKSRLACQTKYLQLAFSWLDVRISALSSFRYNNVATSAITTYLCPTARTSSIHGSPSIFEPWETKPSPRHLQTPTHACERPPRVGKIWVRAGRETNVFSDEISGSLSIASALLS